MACETTLENVLLLDHDCEVVIRDWNTENEIGKLKLVKDPDGELSLVLRLTGRDVQRVLTAVPE